MKKILLIIALMVLLFPTQSNAQEQLTYDLGITADDIYFSDNVLIIGKSIRLYSKIRNHGAKDVVGFVRFYIGNQYLGDSQAVSVVSNSIPDEVYVDWIVPDQPFNIRGEIKGQDPGDENPSNDVALTGIFTPYYDTDGDGIIDDNDLDDDNDKCLDSEEIEAGTDPLNPDTDGDSVNDCDDLYPTDPTKSSDPDPILPPADPIPSYDNSPDNTTPSDNNTSENNDGGVDQNNNNDEDSSALESFGGSVLGDVQNGPTVLFDIERINWRTYKFGPLLRGFNNKNLDYQWRFDDGTSSNRPYPKHTFSSPGNYDVVLLVTDKVLGETYTSDVGQVNISFFNIANYQLWLLLLLLVLILLIILKILKSVSRKIYSKSNAKEKSKNNKTTKKNLKVKNRK